MTTERDAARIVRSWLSSDEHESADRVLDEVLSLLDATPQRRSWGPAWRIADMNTYAKLAMAAAAVVVVAVVGVLFFPRNNGISSPGLSPSAAGSPTPTNSNGSSSPPAPSAGIVFPSEGPIAAGRQRFTQDGNVFTMEVPDGWSSSGLNCRECARDAGWISKGPDNSPTSAWMPIWHVVGVAADPCGKTPAPAAASARALADAVARIPGVDVVTAPEDATVGGKPARHVAIRLRNDIGCAAGDFYLWYADNGTPEFRWGSVVGQTNDVWVVDVDGGTFWIEAETYTGAAAVLHREIQSMVDSIRLE